MFKFLIKGGNKLNGTVRISGSKNAALPILAASLLTSETCYLENVPNIADIHTFLKIFTYLGVKTSFSHNRLEINARHLQNKIIPHHLVSRLRASILFLGPLLQRFNEVKLAFPGGCILGARSVHSHLYALEQLGGKIINSQDLIHLHAKKLIGQRFIMPEMSVTATENAIMAAVLAEGKTEIHLAAAEPHVQDLCHFFNSMGANIAGIGTHTLTIYGVSALKGTTYKITPDYLETGTLAIAAALTGGKVTLENIVPEHLDSLWQKLSEVGARFKLLNDQVVFEPAKNFKFGQLLKTAVYPGFATDLQAPFAVLLTQSEGESIIFETLFEGRLNYLYELEKMGAKIKIINPHQAAIIGPTKLIGVPIASCDIRAGAAMVLAALVAEGETEISNINYIERGYERLDEKLKKLGADIRRKK